MSDYDTTEKIERTDHGFRLTVESTRGTGTRDQDKVKMEARTGGYPPRTVINDVQRDVKDVMADLREFDPDSDGDGDD